MRVSIVTVVAFFAAAVAANGGFAEKTFGGKCRDLTQLGGGKKDQTAITAWCRDNAGQRWQTTLNLNRCIGNKRGKLVWRNNGNFDHTCHNCILHKLSKGPADNVGLKCSCSRRRGKTPKYTEIALAPYSKKKKHRKTLLRLKNGRFVCGSHRGDKTERRKPDEMDRKEPDETDRREPDETDRREPDEMDRKEPDETDRREPDETDRREPDEMDRREPDETEIREHDKPERREASI